MKITSIITKGAIVKSNAAIIIFIACFFALSLIVCLQNSVAANFSLSVSPYEGGFNLNFDKISPASGHVNKEAILTVNSDIAKQYRITQTMFEPLTTVQGASFPGNSFLVYGLRGTNRKGTLSEQPLPVGMGRQVIFTSDPLGSADSFTLVFGLTVPSDMVPGSYRGKIGFTLEAIGSTQPPVTVFLNIFAQVEIESSIEIRNSSGSKSIRLKSTKEGSSSDDIVVNIKGNYGKQFRILQVVNEQPVSPEGNLLDWDAVKFSGSEAKKGVVINEQTPLSDRQQLVYTSSPGGEVDNFVLTYNLGDASSQKAGTYRGKVKYVFDGMGFSSTRLLDTLDLEVEVPRIFELVVAPEMGGTISFRDLRPQQPPKIQEVVFEVKSNMDKRYQVTQNVSSLLTEKEGRVIPQKNFTLKEESIDTKGKLKFQNKTEVTQGQTVLFISDNEGSPDKFKVVYELTVPSDIHSGDYYTNFTYSVTEI